MRICIYRHIYVYTDMSAYMFIQHMCVCVHVYIYIHTYRGVERKRERERERESERDIYIFTNTSPKGIQKSCRSAVPTLYETSSGQVHVT